MEVAESFRSIFGNLYSEHEAAPAAEARASASSDEAVPTTVNVPDDPHITELHDRFERSRQAAAEQQAYLQAAQQRAKEQEEQQLAEADKEFTPGWRHAGLPTKPSPLQLDAQRLASAQLLDPLQLQASYSRHVAKEVLQPPAVFTYSDTTQAPHYLTATNNLKVLQSMTRQAAGKLGSPAAAGSAWRSLPPEQLAAKVGAADARRKALQQQMPAEQWALEQRIITTMHQRLLFLRNPRFPLPPQVQLMHSGAPHKPVYSYRALGSMAAVCRAAASKAAGSSTQAGYAAGAATLGATPGAGVFRLDPPEMVFSEYEAGATYTRTLRIQNLSTVLQPLRVLPPASPYFTTSALRFPAAGSGALAPGMWAELTLTFLPASLADYEDCVQLDALGQRCQVLLAGRRPPPELTLAEHTDMGEAVVGNSQARVLEFVNQGGPGRFQLVPAAQWPQAWDQAQPDGAQLSDEFKVWPAYFDLARGQRTSMTVQFTPSAVGSHQSGFVLVCDNCQVRSYTVAGSGCSVDVAASQLDGRPLAPGELQQQPLWFGQLPPGAATSHVVTVRNGTTLPFPFSWREAEVQQALLPAAPAWQLGSAGGAEEGSVRCEWDCEDGGGGAGGGEGGGAGAGCFTAVPASGVLQPGEELEVTLTFKPRALGRASSSLQLLVDKSVPGSSARPAPSLPLLSVKMAGEGVPCSATLGPASLAVPGALHPHQQHVQHLKLTNTCGAAASFTWAVLPDPADSRPAAAAVDIQPQQGTIPAGESCDVAVTVTALVPGQLRRRLVCQVEHGPRLLAELVAAVQPPDVELAAAGGRLDFGVVRGGGGSRHLKLRIRNTSGSAESSFELSQLPAGGAEGAEEAAGDSAQLAFEPAAGTVAAGGQVEVRVMCTGGHREGLQHMLVACSSGSGRRHLLPASALVAVPRLVVSRQVVATGDLFLGVGHCESVQVANSGLLPCHYEWCALPAAGAVEGQAQQQGEEEQQGAQQREEGRAEVAVEPAKGVLQPGEKATVTVRLKPTLTGGLQLLAICQVRYAPCPAAFLVTGQVRDLQVSWALQDQQGGPLLQPWRQQQEQEEGQGQQEEERQQLERLASHASASSSAAPAAPRAASRCRSAASRPASAAAAATATAAAAAPAAEDYLEANFGCEVPIGHSRRLRLVIRNDTAIRADVRAWFATFGTDASQGLAAGVQAARKLSASRRGAAAASKTGGGGGTSAAGSPEPRHGTAGAGGEAGGGGTLPAITLSDAHEHSRPFRAEQGCAMIARQAAAQQARRVLGGKGLALAVSPPEAVLEPRGCLVLELACHNDMCGNYVDELLVQVGSLPVKRIPVRVGVVGTPLLVQRERMLHPGLHPDGQAATALPFGALPVAVPQQRTFWVHNTSYLDVQLCWDLLDGGSSSSSSSSSSGRGVESSGSSSSEHGRATAVVSGAAAAGAAAGAAALPSSCFSVSPSSTTLKGGQSCMHTVSFASGTPGSCTAVLQGRQYISMDTSGPSACASFVSEDPEAAVNSLATPRGARPAAAALLSFSSRASAQQRAQEQADAAEGTDTHVQVQVFGAGRPGGPLELLLFKTFHPYAASPSHPVQPLQVRLSAKALQPRLAVEQQLLQGWRCFSIHPPSEHRSYRRAVTLSNPLASPLTFELACSGPFQVVSSSTSVPQDADQLYGRRTMAADALHSSWKGRAGGTLCLPPRETLQLVLAFRPPPRERVEQQEAVQQQVAEDVSTFAGCLTAAFANGGVQEVALQAELHRPALTSSAAVLDFGMLHAASSRRMQLVLSNATQVDASWSTAVVRPSIDGVPAAAAAAAAAGRGAGHRTGGLKKEPAAAAAAAAAAEAAAAVATPFCVQLSAGVLPGRGLGLPQTCVVEVECRPGLLPGPAREALHEAVLEVRVAGSSRVVSVALAGRSSLQESLEYGALLARI